MRRELLAYVAVLVAVLAFVVVPWVVSSFFEARAFNEITGKSVTTWQAMFVDLRVQETVK